uniref:AlNc14C68G4755 protein n=1 Tax=Albugo laibachii Nc14 TaxID=890382 RepID=F0WDN5_9STRA|nr:AlNc14C68G4755 [Albugo laibachii Nc14]|eukprot:CCA19311.1 AlNc14C68G4755 [Albugo laibachii Nc14]
MVSRSTQELCKASRHSQKCQQQRKHSGSRLTAFVVSWVYTLLQGRSVQNLLRVPPEATSEQERRGNGMGALQWKRQAAITGMFLGDSDGNQCPQINVLKTPLSKKSDTVERNATGRHGFGVRLWKDIKVLSESSGVQIYGKLEQVWMVELSVFH